MLKSTNTLKISQFFLFLTFFSILISTAFTNIFLLFSVLFGVLSIILSKNMLFLRYDKVSQISTLLFILLSFSLIYTITDTPEALETLKKYAKLTYIPVIYFILKDKYIKDRCVNYFLVGCSVILFLSYAKYFEFIQPTVITYYLDIEYQEKLTHGVTIFQNSIIHGAVLSLFSYLMLFKFFKNNSFLYLIISSLGFYNVIFLNNSRSAYIISIILIFFSIFKFIKNKNTKILITAFLGIILFAGILNSKLIQHRISAAVTEIEYLQNNEYNNSVGLRLLWIKIGIHNILNSPILGSGVGSFKETSFNYFIDNEYDAKVNYSEAITKNSHNEFISISTQLGLVGLFLYILFLIYLFVYSLGSDFGGAVFIIVSVSSIFNSLFFDNMLGIFIILIIALGINKDQSN